MIDKYSWGLVIILTAHGKNVAQHIVVQPHFTHKLWTLKCLNSATIKLLTSWTNNFLLRLIIGIYWYQDQSSTIAPEPKVEIIKHAQKKYSYWTHTRLHDFEGLLSRNPFRFSALKGLCRLQRVGEIIPGTACHRLHGGITAPELAGYTSDGCGHSYLWCLTVTQKPHYSKKFPTLARTSRGLLKFF